MNQIRVLSGSHENEKQRRLDFLKYLKNTPIPDAELLSNLGLFLNRQTLSHILFLHDLYLKIINVHGVIIEFGVRWGRNLALFNGFRGIYEPYNYNRRIIGFDTFSGFPSIHEKDGNNIKAGDYALSENYEVILEDILTYHESESPIAHIKKFELIKGDAVQTFEDYLKSHPETIIALAYFDFDIYEPTKRCLELIQDRMTRGTILAFDELNFAALPGETVALKEVLGLREFAIQRSPLSPLGSYIRVA
jgi:hypothetical protein